VNTVTLNPPGKLVKRCPPVLVCQKVSSVHHRAAPLAHLDVEYGRGRILYSIHV